MVQLPRAANVAPQVPPVPGAAPMAPGEMAQPDMQADTNAGDFNPEQPVDDVSDGFIDPSEDFFGPSMAAEEFPDPDNAAANGAMPTAAAAEDQPAANAPNQENGENERAQQQAAMEAGKALNGQGQQSEQANAVQNNAAEAEEELKRRRDGAGVEESLEEDRKEGRKT